MLQYSVDSSLPSGLIPDCHPSGGARAAICASVGVVEPLAAVALASTTDEVADTAGVALEDVAGAGVDVSALIAFCCAVKVVEAMGQPTPAPSRF